MLYLVASMETSINLMFLGWVFTNEPIIESKQAGAELGQAQLKLGLDHTSTSLHWIAARKLVLL